MLRAIALVITTLLTIMIAITAIITMMITISVIIAIAIGVMSTQWGYVHLEEEEPLVRDIMNIMRS